MTDFQKIAAIMLRIHKHNAQYTNNCKACPLYTFCGGDLVLLAQHAKDIEEICLDWEKRNPIKTNSMALQKLFPKFDLSKVCSRVAGVSNSSDCEFFPQCSECRKLWLDAEYKAGEPNG